jgi:hypothetical protein
VGADRLLADAAAGSDLADHGGGDPSRDQCRVPERGRPVSAGAAGAADDLPGRAGDPRHEDQPRQHRLPGGNGAQFRLQADDRFLRRPLHGGRDLLRREETTAIPCRSRRW